MFNIEKRKDRNWVRGIFGKSATYNAKLVMTAGLSLTNAYVGDTTVGGNVALNPLPQFTKFADLKAYGFLARPSTLAQVDEQKMFGMSTYTTGSYGTGRWYANRIENNRTRLYLQFGLQKYCGVITFYFNCHNMDMAYLARTGMWSSLLRGVGAAGALYASLAIFGGAVVLPLLGLLAILKIFQKMAASQYFYVDPAMDLYLRAVQNMANNQLVHARLVPYMSALSDGSGKDITNDDADGHEQILEMYRGLPEIWKSNGKFDIFKMINRFQILADFQDRAVQKAYRVSGGDPEKYNKLITSWVEVAKEKDKVKEYTDMNVKSRDGKPISVLDAINIAKSEDPGYQVDLEKMRDAASTIDQTTSDLQKTGTETKDQVPKTTAETTPLDRQATGEDPSVTVSDLWKRNAEFNDSLSGPSSQFLAELHDGAQWICFNVDGTGSVSDSFTNNTTAPAIAATINGVSSTARKINFSTAGANTGIAPIDFALDSVKDIAAGAINALQLDGLAGMFGTSQIIIPDTWEDSSTSIGDESYTLQLRSPYGNDISIFQNVTLPLMFILAGCLPIATGKQSYQNPFFCKYISPGRSMSRCAMISSVSVNRGVGNLKWRSDGKMLACDVTITIKDLNPTVATPILNNPSLFDSDNAYTDYMAILGNANMNDLVYKLGKEKLNFNLWKQSIKSTYSEGSIMNSIGNMGITRAFSNLVHGTSKFP